MTDLNYECLRWTALEAGETLADGSASSGDFGG